MKKLNSALILLLTIMIIPAVTYAGNFSTPHNLREDSKIGIDAGYMHQLSKWEADDNSQWLDGQFTQSQIFIQINHLLTKNSDIYFKLGASDFKSDSAFDFTPSKDFASTHSPFIALGYKAAPLHFTNIKAGPFVQATVYSEYTDQKTETIGADAEKTNFTIKLDHKNFYELNAGLSMQADIEDLLVYGGVFFNATNLKITSTITAVNVTTEESEITKSSAKFKEKSNVGAFFGISIPIGTTFNLEIEAQYKSDFSMGIAIRDTF